MRNELKKTDKILFEYFLIGSICSIITYSKIIFSDYISIILVSLYFFPFSFVNIYMICQECFFTKHKYVIFNVIDFIFFCLVDFFGIKYCIFNINYFIISVIGILFSVLPIAYEKIDTNAISLVGIYKSLTRIFMIGVLIALILFISSCQASSFYIAG